MSSGGRAPKSAEATKQGAKAAQPKKAAQSAKAAKPAAKPSAKASKPAPKIQKPAKAAKTAQAKTTAPKAAKGAKGAQPKAAKPQAKTPATKGAKADKSQPKAAKPAEKVAGAAKIAKVDKPKRKLTKAQIIKRSRLSAAQKIAKAQRAAKAIKKGVHTQHKRKVWTTVHFRRPKTLELPKKPKYQRRSVPKSRGLDQYSILKHPLTTESAMKKIEDNNTLVFIVDLRANKHQISRAVNQMYQIKAKSVNTLIRPDGEKKAFVRLTEDHDALDVANKIGII